MYVCCQMRHAGGKELSFKFICSSDASETAPESVSSSQVISVSAYLSAPRMHKRLKSRHVMDVLRSRIYDRSFELKAAMWQVGTKQASWEVKTYLRKSPPVSSPGPALYLPPRCRSSPFKECAELQGTWDCYKKPNPWAAGDTIRNVAALFFFGHILYLLIY